MNDIVKGCVESRKTAIFNAYDIKNQDTLNKVENLFNRIESFANNYNDVMQFESAFATSELNKEYMELFTLIATSETAKVISSPQSEASTTNLTPTKNKSEAQELAEEVTDDVTHAVRRQARQEAYDKVRDIPVVGDVLNVKQHIDFFSRFRKNKDK